MKSTLSIALFLFVFISFGQTNFDGEIRWGEEIKMKRKEVGPMPIGVADGSLYSTKRVKKNTYLQELSLKSLSITEETKLNYTYNDFKLSSIGNFIFNERPVFMTSYIDKKAEKRHYLLHELKKNDLSEPIELATVPYVKIGIVGARKKMAAASEMGAYSFNRIVSDDYETLMISFKNSEGITETILFDKDLDEVSRQEMEIPYENFQLTSGRLSNKGRYYMLGYEYEIEESKALLGRDKRIKGKYHMLMFDAVTGEMEDVALNIDKNIYSSAVKIMDDETCILYGMYSNENASGVSGAFFQKFDSNYDVEFTTLEEFEEDFITQFWSDKAKKKAEKKKKKKNPKKKAEPSLYSYIMHDLAIKENGDFVLLAEQYYMRITTSTYTDANGNTRTTTTYHYYYNDIIAVNCSPQGEVTWKQKVKKRQYSTNDGGYYSSFYTIVQENAILLMYNDKESNMDDAEEAGNLLDKRKQRRNTLAALITLSEDGESERKTLFDFEDDASRTLVPKRCKKMSENEILLYTTARSRTRILGWMTL